LEEIKFGIHGAEDCRHHWTFIQSILKHVKTLKNMLADAKCWVGQFYKVKPDQPAENGERE
jgi:hypothetical protein